jgi:formamidopyrimidine-DNA glycosylase
MPELPEVETIKLGLQKYLIGHKIESIEIKVPKLFEGRVENVVGARVKDIRRFGKGLVIDLSNGYSIAIHIKLTGQLIYRGKGTEKIRVSREKVGDEIPNQYTHIIFELDKGSFLYYNDRRRFGWIRVIKKEDISKMPFFKNMGPEPFKDLTFELFDKIISGKQTAVKPLLMDQARIGGIGNIYANEALFVSSIAPTRSAKTLNDKEKKDLYDAIHKVMGKGMKYGGASELNFVNALGQEGEFQNHTLAYGHKGEKCTKNDGGIIQKTFLGGRGTYFCPKHQK